MVFRKTATLTTTTQESGRLRVQGGFRPQRMCSEYEPISRSASAPTRVHDWNIHRRAIKADPPTIIAAVPEMAAS